MATEDDEGTTGGESHDFKQVLQVLCIGFLVYHNWLPAKYTLEVSFWLATFRLTWRCVMEKRAAVLRHRAELLPFSHLASGLRATLSVPLARVSLLLDSICHDRQEKFDCSHITYNTDIFAAPESEQCVTHTIACIAPRLVSPHGNLGVFQA
jgi:hypothetical protein